MAEFTEITEYLNKIETAHRDRVFDGMETKVIKDLTPFIRSISVNGVLQEIKKNYLTDRTHWDAIKTDYKTVLSETFEISKTFSEMEKRLFDSRIKQIQKQLENPVNRIYPPKEVEQPKAKQTNMIKERHNNIFKNDAFGIFERYHSDKQLTEHSRTDLRVIFELMKIDNLLVDTVELKHYINWLNKTYAYSLIELKKVDLESKPNKQRRVDYKRITGLIQSN